MSSGDIDNTVVDEQVIEHLWQNQPSMVLFLQQEPTYSWDYDIPYFGGVSIDGSKVYGHRRYPKQLQLEDQKYIGLHERSEWWLVVVLKFSYLRAHRYANSIEDMALRKDGREPAAYNRQIDLYIPKFEHHKIEITPRDLALYPYKDDPKLMARIREAMV